MDTPRPHQRDPTSSSKPHDYHLHHFQHSWQRPTIDSPPPPNVSTHWPHPEDSDAEDQGINYAHLTMRPCHQCKVPINLFILSVCLPVSVYCLPVCLSVCMSVSVCVCLYVCLSVYVYCLPVCLSICLSVCTACQFLSHPLTLLSLHSNSNFTFRD